MKNVKVVSRCHICFLRKLASADKQNKRNLYDQLVAVHDLNLPEKRNRKKQKPDSELRIVTKSTLEKEPNLQYSLVFECVLCDHLALTVEALAAHFKEHLQSSEEHVDDLDSDKILINKGKRTHIFDTTLTLRIRPQDTPKFTGRDMERLSSMFILRVQSAGNLDETSKTILDAHFENQRQLTSLKRYPKCLSELQAALSCSSCYDLDDFAFTPLDTNTTTNQERRFHRVIKHVLLDYASKCFRRTAVFSNHERTFFSVRLVPIFSCFEDHFQNIHFEWGEVTVRSRQAVSFSVPVSQSTTSSFADGIGYSINTGAMDEERVIFESSSGALKENVQHTYGDTLKNLEALTAIVMLKAYTMCNASFSTLTRFKALCIHSIKRTLTLSVLYITPNKDFVFEEQRTAVIPLGYSERHNWYQVFELMARLQELLEEQDSVDAELRKQHASAMVQDEDTIRRAFESRNMQIELNIPH